MREGGASQGEFLGREILEKGFSFPPQSSLRGTAAPRADCAPAPEGRREGRVVREAGRGQARWK